MSSISDALSAEVTRVAMCWKLLRGDGVVLGFTSHDRDLVIDGVTYRSGPGMTPSAVSQGDALRSDSMDVEGVLGADSIRAFDLQSGRWSGSRVEILVCDWEQPELGHLGIVQGTIGDVSHPFPVASGAFRAELLSDGHRIERLAPTRLSPMCRSELGDGRCGVDMDGRRTEVVVASCRDDRLTLATAMARPEEAVGGRLRFVDGPLCGLDRRIEAIDGADLVLEDRLPDVSLAGTRAWIWEGCDKRLDTCGTRFGNALAFNGEPHVPGTDALLRYSDS